MAFSRVPRETGTKPLATSAGPHTGTLVSSSLRTMRIDPGTAPISAGMSSSEVWLVTTIDGRVKCSRPSTTRRALPEEKMRRQ
ncbi:MAG: hypothetical protein WKG00_37035 [Polyangiaceae bacterium]